MTRHVIDCGDGIEVHACVEHMDEKTQNALAELGRAAVKMLDTPKVPCSACGRESHVDPCWRCYAEANADA